MEDQKARLPTGFDKSSKNRQRVFHQQNENPKFAVTTLQFGNASRYLIHLGDVFVPSSSVTKVHFQASSRNRASETNKMDPGSSQVPHLETILREDVNEKSGYLSSKDQPCIVHLDFLLNGGGDKYTSTMNEDWQSKNRC